jgi:two-component system, chemotaxis family, chemotaxis protein CheY
MSRILLIDDDDLVRTMVEKVLTLMGHTVIEARDGREGLERFEDSKAELVITDIVMPEKEGTEVIMELLKLEPTLKIIAISGGGRRSSFDYLRVARHLGAVIVLGKPFSTEALLAAVKESLLDDFPDPLAIPPS